jgi:hypothetical protein
MTADLSNMFINEGDPDAPQGPTDIIKDQKNKLYNSEESKVKHWRIEDNSEIIRKAVTRICPDCRKSLDSCDCGKIMKSEKTVPDEAQSAHKVNNPPVKKISESKTGKPALSAGDGVYKADLTEGPECPKCKRKVAHSIDSQKGTKQPHCPYCKNTFGEETAIKKALLKKAVGTLVTLMSNEIDKEWKFGHDNRTSPLEVGRQFVHYGKDHKQTLKDYPPEREITQSKRKIKKEKTEKKQALGGALLGAGIGSLVGHPIAGAAIGGGAGTIADKFIKKQGPALLASAAKDPKAFGEGVKSAGEGIKSAAEGVSSIMPKPQNIKKEKYTADPKNIGKIKHDKASQESNPKTIDSERVVKCKMIKEPLRKAVENLTTLIKSEIEKGNSPAEQGNRAGQLDNINAKLKSPPKSMTPADIGNLAGQRDNLQAKINPQKEKSAIRVKKSIILNKALLGDVLTPINDLELVKGYGSIEAIPDIVKSNRMPQEYFDYAISRFSLFSDTPFQDVCKMWYGEAVLTKAVAETTDKRLPEVRKPVMDNGGQSEVQGAPENSNVKDLAEKSETLKYPDLGKKE